MMLCSANYIHSVVVSGCVQCSLKQIRIIPEFFFLPYVSQLAALGPEAHAGMRGRVWAGAGGRGHVQAFAKYIHVEVM